MASPAQSAAPKRLTRLQRATLIVLTMLLIGSAIARAVLLSKSEPASSATSSTLEPSNYLASTRSTPAESSGETSAFEDALPFVTEGSLFALIGFALGYTTRKVFKIGLIVLAVAFVAIQALTYAKVASVDWGGLVDWLNRAVLNLKENDTVTQFVTRRIPSTGALVAGALLGFKRG